MQSISSYAFKNASNAVSWIKDVYSDINPSTLSGAIDIIVIEHPDGSLSCSPFHVRFGKTSILRTQDQKVDLKVNGTICNIQMRVGDIGEGFFMLDESDQDGFSSDEGSIDLNLDAKSEGYQSPVEEEFASVRSDPGYKSEEESSQLQKLSKAGLTHPTASRQSSLRNLSRSNSSSPELMPIQSLSATYSPKSLRMTSDQLLSLNLVKGKNELSFFINGEEKCNAHMFFWDEDVVVVISDIDGTITKSDALGHLFAFVGKDWTHASICGLYSKIYKNGYKMLYLTSRAIGQAPYTRSYLDKVAQGIYKLPPGPVFLSPDRLYVAFRREVIQRRPEIFKMACLKDIKRVFKSRNPFYAGFGNRNTDAISYRSVEVPNSRIFVIDHLGILKLEQSYFQSSYGGVVDLVDHIFPPLRNTSRFVTEFADHQYFQIPLPKIPDEEFATDIKEIRKKSTVESPIKEEPLDINASFPELQFSNDYL